MNARTRYFFSFSFWAFLWFLSSTALCLFLESKSNRLQITQPMDSSHAVYQSFLFKPSIFFIMLDFAWCLFMIWYNCFKEFSPVLWWFNCRVAVWGHCGSFGVQQYMKSYVMVCFSYWGTSPWQHTGCYEASFFGFIFFWHPLVVAVYSMHISTISLLPVASFRGSSRFLWRDSSNHFSFVFDCASSFGGLGFYLRLSWFFLWGWRVYLNY